MGFWEWAGAAVITGLSGGVGLKLVGWLKEHLDRKARKISYHAKSLLDKADELCGMARALQIVVKDEPGGSRYRAQASVLWTVKRQLSVPLSDSYSSSFLTPNR